MMTSVFLHMSKKIKSRWKTST